MGETDPFVEELEWHIKNIKSSMDDTQVAHDRVWMKGQKSGFEYALALYLELKS